jgi:uncharacterized protein (DUF924 family)
MSEISEVLDFWFADGMAKKWFVKDDAFDRELRARFAGLYAHAAAGAMDGWMDSPQGCVALCILLDQAPRNLFRGDPRAFATDAAALAVTRHAMERGFDRALPQAQRLFLYLPFEHSEAMADQDLCVSLLEGMDEDPKWLAYARQHREVVVRFGRFPHRNALLDRETTPEEARFLKQTGSSF